MNIPNNSLTEQIKEIISVCEELAEDYGDDASWFNPPATEEEISKWEGKSGIIIPESYKNWLRFANGAQILSHTAQLYGLDMISNNSFGVSDDLVVIGTIIGDGEQLCFEKETGNFVEVFEGQQKKIGSFQEELKRIIRLCSDDCHDTDLSSKLFEILERSRLNK